MGHSTMHILKTSIDQKDKQYVETVMNSGSTFNADIAEFDRWWEKDTPRYRNSNDLAKLAWMASRGWEVEK